MAAGFTSFARWRSVNVAVPERELPETLRQRLPAGFDAVGEALVSGGSPLAACAVVGRAMAQDGASLGEALDGLRATYEVVLAEEPAFTAAESLSVAWSEATLQFLHEISCEDPLTGMASRSHLRTRLDEMYREADRLGTKVRQTHAIVVVETRSRERLGGVDQHFSRALRLAQVADAIRDVYSGGETIGRVAAERAVAVVRRDGDLGVSVTALRAYLDDLDLGRTDVRIWIEGLPASPESAAKLLDELAR